MIELNEYLEGNVKRILLMDVSPKYLWVVENVLLPYKDQIKFYGVTALDRGIEIALEAKPDVIALDFRMCGTISEEATVMTFTGEDAIKRLRSLLPKTKIIVISAWETNEEWEREKLKKETGVVDFFDKPVDLRGFVKQMLEHCDVAYKGGH